MAVQDAQELATTTRNDETDAIDSAQNDAITPREKK